MDEDENEKNPYEEILEAEEKIENYSVQRADDEHKIHVRSHLEKEIEDECGYCGQAFVPDEIVIEKVIHGRKWKFCSEDCYRDFLDKVNFKDEDLDSDEGKDSATYNIEDEG